MNELREALRQAAPLSNLLGYLNFSAGKPDSRFARSWNEASAELLRRRVDLPWLALLDVLQDELRGLQSEGSSAFKDTAQAESVLRLLRHTCCQPIAAIMSICFAIRPTRNCSSRSSWFGARKPSWPKPARGPRLSVSSPVR